MIEPVTLDRARDLTQKFNATQALEYEHALTMILCVKLSRWPVLFELTEASAEDRIAAIKEVLVSREKGIEA